MVVRFILVELTTQSAYNPVLDKQRYKVFEQLGLTSPESRTWVKNKRYKLKVERDTNYPKFRATCAEAQVPCPENNNWLRGLEPEEFDLDNLPEIEEEAETTMAPSNKMSSSSPYNRMSSSSPLASSKMMVVSSPPPLPSTKMMVVSSPHQHEYRSKFYLLLKCYFVYNFSTFYLQLQTTMDLIAFNLIFQQFIRYIPVLLAYM